MKPLCKWLALFLIAETVQAWPNYSSFPWLSNNGYNYVERRETLDLYRLTTATRPRIRLDLCSTSLKWVRADLTKEWQRFEFETKARSMIMSGSKFRHSALDSLRFRPWPFLFGTFYSDNVHLYSYASQWDNFAFSVQPVYGLEFINTDDKRGTISRFTGGFRVEAGYDQKLYGMVDFRDHNETGNGPYDSRDKLYEDRWAAVDLKGNSSTSYDISESLIQWYGRDLALTAGRGRHQWGPGYFGGLMLNSYAPPFDYVRFDAAPSIVNYTFLHGFLESATPADTLYYSETGRPRTINAQKYISAQRIEVVPHKIFLAGFSQAVIYGDRGLQLGYLTPFNFLYSVQHSNDDKDNLLWSLDFKYRPVRGLKLYGELLLDDVVVGDLFTNSGNNKSAYTVGAHGIIPRDFWSHFDARVEYTKIRPFVYSHFFATNIYTHWTSPLGYTLEPNSEFINLRLGATFYPVYFAASYRRQNHGANTDTKNVGGSLYRSTESVMASEYPFLDGQFEHEDRMTFEARWEVLPNLNLLGSIASITRSRVPDRTEIRAGFGWNL
jgi:hypothetical protein